MWTVNHSGECYGRHDNEEDARKNFEMRLTARPSNKYEFTLVHPDGRREMKTSKKVGEKTD